MTWHGTLHGMAHVGIGVAWLKALMDGGHWCECVVLAGSHHALSPSVMADGNLGVLWRRQSSGWGICA